MAAGAAIGAHSRNALTQAGHLGLPVCLHPELSLLPRHRMQQLVQEVQEVVHRLAGRKASGVWRQGTLRN